MARESEVTEPIKPATATDEEISEYLRLHLKRDGEYWNCDLDANVTVRQLIARIQSDAAKLKALELERDTIQEYADRNGANLRAAEGTLAERDEQIARYEDLIAAYSETDAKAQKAEEIGGGYETRAAAIEFLKAEKAVAAEGRAILARRKEASRG